MLPKEIDSYRRHTDTYLNLEGGTAINDDTFSGVSDGYQSEQKTKKIPEEDEIVIKDIFMLIDSQYDRHLQMEERENLRDHLVTLLGKDK